MVFIHNQNFFFQHIMLSFPTSPILKKVTNLNQIWGKVNSKWIRKIFFQTVKQYKIEMVTFFPSVCCKIIIIQTHISIYNIFPIYES